MTKLKKDKGMGGKVHWDLNTLFTSVGE